MNEHKTYRSAFWLPVSVIALPLVYVLSYGPAQIALVRELPVVVVDADGTPFTLPPSVSVGATYDSTLFDRVYAPLEFVFDTTADSPLSWYRELFRGCIPVDSSRAPLTTVVDLDRDVAPERLR